MTKAKRKAVPKASANGHIAPGDLVYLKSGGPKMTVGIIEGDIATCSWFNSDYSELQSRGFMLSYLTKCKS